MASSASQDETLTKKTAIEPTVTEKPPPTDDKPNNAGNPTSPPRSWPTIRAWMILFAHCGACIALAMSLAFGLDGYKAGDESTPRTGGRRLLLRVSDVTTLVSVALVAIKGIAGAFSVIALWAAGRYMLSGPSQQRTGTRTVSNMLRWKLPPWIQGRTAVPWNLRSLIISLTTLALFIQPFTGPLLTGSVDWNAGFTLLDTATPVSSVDATADFGMWYWYNAQGAFDKRAYLRAAAGYAGAAWADPSTVDSTGKSTSGNGCRHIVNDNGLPPDSVLIDATIPCINIESITWYRNIKDVPGNYWADVEGKSAKLTLVEDDPYLYYKPGVAFAYDGNQTHPTPSDHAALPKSTVWSGALAVMLLVDRHNNTDPPCQQLSNTKFGNIDALPHYKLSYRRSDMHESCYLIGQIKFTAGVTKVPRARYLTPRIVEDQRPLEEVKFEANPWVREAVWWMPDLMPLLAMTNASQTPTFNNIDGYVAGTVRQAYLGAWDMLSRGFEEEGPAYSAYAAEPRLVASVRQARVFAWMALCLLVTVFGALLLAVVLKREHMEGRHEREGRTTLLEDLLGCFGG